MSQFTFLLFTLSADAFANDSPSTTTVNTVKTFVVTNAWLILFDHLLESEWYKAITARIATVVNLSLL